MAGPALVTTRHHLGERLIREMPELRRGLLCEEVSAAVIHAERQMTRVMVDAVEAAHGFEIAGMKQGQRPADGDILRGAATEGDHVVSRTVGHLRDGHGSDPLLFDL
jgi:hypothetical protein